MRSATPTDADAASRAMSDYRRRVEENLRASATGAPSAQEVAATASALRRVRDGEFRDGMRVVAEEAAQERAAAERRNGGEPDERSQPLAGADRAAGSAVSLSSSDDEEEDVARAVAASLEDQNLTGRPGLEGSVVVGGSSSSGAQPAKRLIQSLPGRPPAEGAAEVTPGGSEEYPDTGRGHGTGGWSWGLA